jgi:hypothetical protein
MTEGDALDVLCVASQGLELLIMSLFGLSRMRSCRQHCYRQDKKQRKKRFDFHNISLYNVFADILGTASKIITAEDKNTSLHRTGEGYALRVFCLLITRKHLTSAENRAGFKCPLSEPG